VAQDEDLQVLGGFAAGEQHEQLYGAAQREVGEFRQHQGDLCGGLVEAPRYRAAAGANWQLTATSEFAHPTSWRYVYRAIDQFGQVIDVFVSSRRDATAARRFFQQAIATTAMIPVEVVTDRAAAYPAVLDELLPMAWHRAEQYANNRVEADHGRLKARLRPMRGLKQDRSARVVIAGHSFMQNLRRGHYELAVEEPVTRRLAVAFNELALVI
jgi:IS6 family transposase